MPAHRLRPNEGEVAAKVFDGEAILINLSSGAYYSMAGVGGLIWELIERGHSLDEIAGVVGARYEVPTDLARADIERLADELVRENSVVDPPDGPKLPYVSPTLNIYRDMGDLLALDPPMPALDEIRWEEPPERSAR
jgi:Coenzyme PQQ synthesis protein D (PqqD)